MVSKKLLLTGLGLAVGVSAAAAAYFWSYTATVGQPASSAGRVPVIRGGDSLDKVGSGDKLTAVVAGQKRLSASTNYKQSFAASHNYWEFAHHILPAAKAGNADAQYYLSRVLDRCAEDNKMYFQHKGRVLTLDEGLQFAVQRRLSVETAQSVYEKCHDFAGGDLTELGNANDWLAKAAAAGQPMAQVTTASRILTQELQQDFVKAGGVPNPNQSTSTGDTSDPRQLLREAVESKDPEVLFSIGEAQVLLNTSDHDKNTTRFAWWLVACERGFDCSANAEWVQTSCSNDPQCASASGPDDLVRTLAGDSWPAVQQRAQRIQADLEANRWNDLGLGS